MAHRNGATRSGQFVRGVDGQVPARDADGKTYTTRVFGNGPNRPDLRADVATQTWCHGATTNRRPACAWRVKARRRRRQAVRDGRGLGAVPGHDRKHPGVRVDEGGVRVLNRAQRAFQRRVRVVFEHAVVRHQHALPRPRQNLLRAGPDGRLVLYQKRTVRGAAIGGCASPARCDTAATRVLPSSEPRHSCTTSVKTAAAGRP